MTTMHESLAVVIRSWIVSAVGGSPKVFWDHPIGNVTSLPRYCIIGPIGDNSSSFIGEQLDTGLGTLHTITYDLEIWSKDSKDAIIQADKIESYILSNRSTFRSNKIIGVEITGHAYKYEKLIDIHRRIVTIRLVYSNER